MFFYSHAEYTEAVRYVAANNRHCVSEASARDRLDELIRDIAEIALSRSNPVTQAGSLGLNLIRIFGSDRISICVSPALAETTKRGFDWNADARDVIPRAETI